MAYTPSAVAPRHIDFTETRPVAAAKPGVWRRLFTAMQAARLRQAESEVARYLAETGGKFTDESEREIERRFLSTPSRW